MLIIWQKLVALEKWVPKEMGESLLIITCIKSWFAIKTAEERGWNVCQNLSFLPVYYSNSIIFFIFFNKWGIGSMVIISICYIFVNYKTVIIVMAQYVHFPKSIEGKESSRLPACKNELRNLHSVVELFACLWTLTNPVDTRIKLPLKNSFFNFPEICFYF